MVCFETLGLEVPSEILRNPERGCALCPLKDSDATLSELGFDKCNALVPGLPKRNPGLELANAFSV